MPTTPITARMRVRTVPPVRVSARDDERENEAEERERLGERDPEEHRGSHGSGRLGVAVHSGDDVADHQADAVAVADGGGAAHDSSTDLDQPLVVICCPGGGDVMQDYHQ